MTTNLTNNELINKAMLVKIRISVWTAKKHDSEISEQILEQHGADKKYGRFWKYLMKDTEELDAINKISTKIRKFNEKLTLPWHDEGIRILPSSLFQKYSSSMRQFKEEFDIASEKFLSLYSSLIESARISLNGLFCEADYPAIEKIGSKFKFDVKIDPIPYSDDFRVALQQEEIKRIKQEIDQRVEETKTIVVNDLLERLKEKLLLIVDRLQPDNQFKRNTFENLVELLSIIPDLNFTNDPRIEQIRKEIEEKISFVSPEALREDAVLREKTSEDASEILQNIENMMSGYTGLGGF
ncbi:MAG: hypothetical protein HQK79_20420 [Desulfobacterales bacterium]|nr:hypothetical protein [Desulfobacterales bacterium]